MLNFLGSFTRLNWNYQTIAATIAIAAYLIMILLVAIKARRHPATKLFILTNFAVVSWISGFTAFSMVKDGNVALFLGRIFELGAIFTGPLYQHLATRLFKIKLQKHYIKIYYFIGGVFSILDLLTPYFIKGVVSYKYWYSYWFLNPAPIYYIFPFVFAYFVLNLTYRLYLYSQENPHQRNQVRFFIVGILLASLGGCFYFTGILVNMPYFLHFPHDYLTILLPIVTTYNIIRYRLMEIDTVIHRTVLWFITSVAVFLPIFGIIYFIRGWLHDMGGFNLSLILTLFFFPIIWYYKKIQPKIDHLFRRRKYDYQTILGKIAEKIVTTINIEDLTRQLLTEVCEVMYLQNSALYVLTKDASRYSLVGRLGYQEVNGVRQRAALELFIEEEKTELPESQRQLLRESPISKWLDEHLDILEKEQVEVSPLLEAIKEEVINWFKEQEIELLIPLAFENKVNALLGLGRKESLQGYTLKDLQLLKKIGQEIGITVFNVLHYEDISEKERLEDEMKMGRQIQMELLPKETPLVQGLIAKGLMLPAKEIGGDYYDFISLPYEERFAIIIGDVSGKGVAAGLIMSMTKATIHNLAEEGFSPREILLRTNRFLNKHIGGQKFMTLLYLLWQPETKTLTYSSAGHEHILIYRNDSSQYVVGSSHGKEEKAYSGYVEAIQSGGFMLGMLPNIEVFLEERQIKLNAGDKILLYTDGVTEAENQGGERFGLLRLIDAFKTHSQKSAQELMQAVKDEVYVFIGTHPQYDDITLVVMEAE